MDHIRGAHDVPGEIRKVSLETLFPAWTVICQVYTDSLTSRHSGISNDVLLFSDIGLSLVHHYRVHKSSTRRVQSGITCRSCALCYRCLRSCRSREGRPTLLLDSAMCDGIAGCGGAVVFDCRPPLLPVSMDISGVDLSVIRASAMSAEAVAFPPEREQ